MKKILAILLVMAMTLTMVACGSSSEEAETDNTDTAETAETADTAEATDTAEAIDTAEGIKVGFVVKSLADQYWFLVKAGAQIAAEENNVELTFIAPNSESDVQKQVENIETLIASGVDVLCVAPSNDETVLPVLETAVAAGIKVIAVDTDSSLEEKVCFIGTGNESAAKEGAIWAGTQISEGGTAIVLRGRLGDATHDAREAGILAGLEETGIEVLEVQAADSEEETAMNVTENLLQKYPDVDLVITTADSMATGAFNAIETASSDAQVYGFDGTIPVAEKVANGTILGTPAQDPYAMGVLAIDTAIQVMNGENVESVIDSGQSIITKDNAADFKSDLEKKVELAE